LEDVYKRQSNQFRDEMQGLYTMMAGAIASQTQIEEVRLAVEAIVESHRDAGLISGQASSRVSSRAASSSIDHSAEAAGRNGWAPQINRLS